MAIYVEIRKERETPRGFVYRYVAADGSVGSVEIDRTNGQTAPIAQASGDRDGRALALTTRKLSKHFAAGEFPDETCWAS